MEIAIYARVSTERQQQTQTITLQIERLQAHVTQQAHWHLTETHIYRDDGYSGATLNRPGLDRLRDAAALGAFELLLITAPDRLARNLAHQALLIEELRRLGCRVEFLERPMSDDPHDQLLLQIRGAVAEYERTLIAERMRRGRQAKLRNGLLLPWTVPLYGYTLDPAAPRDPQRVQINPAQAAVVQQVFAWYTASGTPVSIEWIAKQLTAQQIPTPKGKSRWHPASVRNILCNTAYAGHAHFDPARQQPGQRRRCGLGPWGRSRKAHPVVPEDVIMIPVPAIVSPETFAAAQGRMERNLPLARRNNTRHDYLLRGLVSCARCRYACLARTTHTGYNYYACTGRTHPERVGMAERCTAAYMPATALDDLVWQDLRRLLAQPALISHALTRAQAGEWLPQELQARRQTLAKNLSTLERQQARLLDAYLADIIGQDEFARKRKELRQTQQGLTQQLRQLEAQARQHLQTTELASGVHDFCQRIQPTLENLNFAQRRQLVELLIDRVIINNDHELEIHYVIPTAQAGANFPFVICD